MPTLMTFVVAWSMWLKPMLFVPSPTTSRPSGNCTHRLPALPVVAAVPLTSGRWSRTALVAVVEPPPLLRTVSLDHGRAAPPRGR